MKLSAEKEAVKAVKTYIEGLNDKDPAKLANSLHFPHIRSMKDGTFFEWHSPKEYMEAFKSRLKSLGIGAVKVIFFNVIGCIKPNSIACNAWPWRLIGNFLHLL